MRRLQLPRWRKELVVYDIGIGVDHLGSWRNRNQTLRFALDLTQ
jgi:hypothetical protein